MNKRKEWSKIYYQKNKKKILEYSRKYYKNNKKRRNEVNKKWREKNSEKYYKRVRELKEERKNKVLNFFDNQCKCCGEKQKKFLAIDHINGGGTEHYKKIPGRDIYRWLIKNNFPEGFQILCYNCNMAKGFYGKCPHLETK